ncbi:MAG: methyltransferase [Eubacterium sp.]|nr:methyltransferase [Eubacterium sp.]
MQFLIEQIKRKEEVRAALSQLKQCLKEDGVVQEFLQSADHDIGFLYECLKNEDAKTRKNAAGVLEKLAVQEALDPLYQAWLTENTLFVNSSYLKAMAALDCREYLLDFNDRLEQLETMEIPEEEKKHRREEVRALQKILVQSRGIDTHEFIENKMPVTVLLTVHKGYGPLLCRQFKEGTAKVVPLGVVARISNFKKLQKIRFWKELLIPVKISDKAPAEPDILAELLADSNILKFLKEYHKGGDRYYFRMDIIGNLPQDSKNDLIKKTAVRLEEKSGHRLVNSASDYEIEIRLFRTKDGFFLPFLHLGTIPDERFAYRRKILSTAMNPVQAALLAELSKPYLKPQAQVLDPFCGAGILLIERQKAVAAKVLFGTDTFGEAVLTARENTKAAGISANYMNRNFFDFTHKSLFDEIITEFPEQLDGKREELDRLYERFFEKCTQLLTKNGRLFLVSKEEGRIKKQMRLTKKYRLLQEHMLREKSGLKLFIIERKEE